MAFSNALRQPACVTDNAPPATAISANETPTVVEGLGDRDRCIVPELPFGAQLVSIDDSCTVIPIDQPQALTDPLRASSTRTPEAGGAQAPTGTNALPRPPSCFDWRRRHKLTVASHGHRGLDPKDGLWPSKWQFGE